MGLHNVKISPKEWAAIQQLRNDCEALVGCGDEDSDNAWVTAIDLIDRITVRNNLPHIDLDTWKDRKEVQQRIKKGFALIDKAGGEG